MYYNKVEICGVNTSQLTVLSDAEKRELLVKSKEGDSDARKALICGNLRLVLSIIQRFVNRRENPDDLFQVGCIGLVKAVDNFNIALDVKFSTYAVPMIIGEIRRYLRDNNTIRISRSVRDLAYRSLQAREEWIRESEGEPDIDQLAARLGEKRKRSFAPWRQSLSRFRCMSRCLPKAETAFTLWIRSVIPAAKTAVSAGSKISRWPTL